MNDFLLKQFQSALQQAQGSHSSNISRDHLDLFVRVARMAPSELDPVIDILLGNIEAHRSNTVASLYCLLSLADVSEAMRTTIGQKVSDDFISFYAEDENQDIAGNARILKAVLEGAPLSNFQRKESAMTSASGSVTYNLHNSNLAINSPNSSLSLEIKDYDQYDDETKKLLVDLKEALEKKDKSKVKQILSFLADKGFDLLVALLAGQILQSK